MFLCKKEMQFHIRNAICVKYIENAPEEGLMQ